LLFLGVLGIIPAVDHCLGWRICTSWPNSVGWHVFTSHLVNNLIHVFVCSNVMFLRQRVGPACNLLSSWSTWRSFPFVSRWNVIVHKTEDVWIDVLIFGDISLALCAPLREWPVVHFSGLWRFFRSWESITNAVIRRWFFSLVLR